MAACNVSVVIPSHNEGLWLERTIHSIREAATHLKYEIIIFDDASTDESIDRVRSIANVRVLSAGAAPVGLVVGRNRGAAAARGDYLCYLDAHVLVRDHWIDYLCETSQLFGDRALVSGNILDVRTQGSISADLGQYAYTLKDWCTATGWHFHGLNVKQEPYLAPLCPGGLIFVRRSHLFEIGGFNECIRKWGGDDAEISLKNWMLGGDNIVDPRVIVYHNYKNLTDNQRTFTISYRETYFNWLFIARTFCSNEVYETARAYLARQADIDPIVEELESDRYDSEINAIRSRFVRTWEDFERSFQCELDSLAVPKSEIA